MPYLSGRADFSVEERWGGWGDQACLTSSSTTHLSSSVSAVAIFIPHESFNVSRSGKWKHQAGELLEKDFLTVIWMLDMMELLMFTLF